MPSKSGNDRGVCSKEANHKGRHGNQTCYRCGEYLTSNNAPPSSVRRHSGPCSKCHVEEQRERLGRTPKERPVPGAQFTFRCGCSGILPSPGQSNLFAKCNSKKKPGHFKCRVHTILYANTDSAKRYGGYVPIDPTTPHSVIREMMEKSCVLCGEPLDWTVLGPGVTPHLHHDHENGKIHGFTHPACNRFESEEIFRLKAEVKKLQQEVQFLKAA